MNMDIIAVTPGDPEGVGPEIVWKCIQRFFPIKKIAFLCIGAKKPFEKLGAPIILAHSSSLKKGILPPLTKKPVVWLLPTPTRAPILSSGKKAFLAGYQSGWAIEKATRLVQLGICSALTTGPISKERLQRGGYYYPGHTEFLADLCKTKDVTMMLANEHLRISLVTTHLALKNVSKSITRPKFRRTILHTVDHLQNWWKIDHPRIAIAALNPHAGENGLFGREEIKVILPELKTLKKSLKKRCALKGPFPADTLFAKNNLVPQSKRFDAVVCMYHDQGLIPVKLLDFPKTVNITLGLPIIRTSVDHGVGFDIAGTGKADPSSLQSALSLAIKVVKNTKQHRGQK